MQTNFVKAGVVLAIVAVQLAPVPALAQQAPPPMEEADLPALPGIEQSPTEAICGAEDDSQDVEVYDGGLGVPVDYVARHAPSTFLLRWRAKADLLNALPREEGGEFEAGNVAERHWCSATLIGERTAITARHCFEPIGDDPYESFFTKLRTPRLSGEWVQPQQLAPMLVASFNYQLQADGEMRKDASFPVLRLVEDGVERGGLDYAIIELGPDADGRLPVDHFGQGIAAEISTRTLASGELIAVIQHPNGDPKRIDAGYILGLDSPWVYYNDVDTLSGSSGSAIRDAFGAVVGIHTNGGCDEESYGFKNRGILLQSIAEISDILLE